MKRTRKRRNRSRGGGGKGTGGAAFQMPLRLARTPRADVSRVGARLACSHAHPPPTPVMSGLEADNQGEAVAC